MPRNRSAIWLLVSMMLLWISVTVAEPPEPESTPAVVESPATAGQEGLRGVVIEEIPKGSTLERAGLQVGDVILSWERLPNPPANPESAQGELASHFDWRELEAEQAPRGKVVLRASRGNAPLHVEVEPGIWEAKTRPVLSTTLKEILEHGRSQLSTKDLEGAAETFQLLADHAPDGDSRDVHTWVLVHTGKAFSEAGDQKRALDSLKRAVESASSSVSKIAALEELGTVNEKLNSFEAAEEAYNSALSIRQLKPESIGVAIDLDHLGDVAWARGDLDLAQGYVLRAQQIREKLAPNSLEVADSLNRLGTLAWSRGKMELVKEYNLTALTIQRHLAPRGRGTAASLANLGALAETNGELDRAQNYLQDALHLEEQLVSESLSLATTLNNLGYIAQDRGDLGRASDYFSRALQLQNKLAPKSLAVARSLTNLGSVAQYQFHFDRAVSYYQQALQLQEELAHESLDVAATLNNLGSVALSRDELDRAYDFHLRALKIKERIAARSLTVAYSLSNLGTVAWRRGDLTQAEDHYIKGLAICEQLAPESLTVAQISYNIGAVALARGDLERARSFLLRSMQIRNQLAPRSLAFAQSLNRLGDEAWARRDLSSAVDYYTHALDAVDNQISKLGASYNIQANFRSRHSNFYGDLMDCLLTGNRHAEAFQTLERFRAQTLLIMLTERDLAFTADIPEALDLERRRVATLYDRILKKLGGLNTRDHAEQIESARTELRRLEDEAGDIEARIRSASPKLAALRYPHPLDAAATQQMLDPGTLLLSFSMDKDKTTLFALSRSGDLETRILASGEETLRSRTKQLLTLIPEAKGGSSLSEQRRTQLQAISRELYTELLAPVADRIAASERLLILPDGPLHALPFGALVHDTEDGPQYLGAWKPLHVALSATVFAELKQGRRPAGDQDTVPAPLQLAAFGDPVYPQSLRTMKVSAAALPADGDVVRGDPTVRGAAERGLFDFQPLPYSRREVQGIAGLFPQGSARTFLGPEALEERIKSLDPNTRILHLSAHGSIDEHLPSGSFIALTIPEEAASEETGPQRDNGLLQVWEIFERVRLNADLVVLSACDTGLGEELGGEGLIGLTRAFQYAGARTVMASLWSVQDQATAELMIRFYKHLRAGLSKDRALQAAQQELLHGPIEVTNDKGERVVKDFSAPYYWAGFQLYGDWQ